MSNIKVLLIEDDKDQIMIYQNKLELEEMKLISAEDKEEGLKLAEEEPPSLILLDLLLGNEDGLDILKELKKKKKTKEIPVIIFTNFDTEEARENCKNLGAEDYLLKARVTPDEVAEKIKQVAGQ